ncbi:AAA family ATPase [Halobacillus andaensis]|uniref:AAA family ATPase n=1 Tax=Halobacillus andaensis TaxID=1176239 RepID=UPI003D71E416
MRALNLTVQAFGPFKNKQTIDFSQLGDETIFLVTGPTGAGKTTIFDAMCFALYGRASGMDREQDTLKSHFAGETDTTVVDFTFMLRGKQYRIERMPKQWKKKERGEGLKEEPTKANLYQQQNGEERLIASKIKEVNEMIEELLRLDYDQFRKMIMIPQGEFRKLISENSREREEILQKIFRTHFYSELTDYLRGQQRALEKDMEQFEWKIEQETEKIQWLPGQMEEIPQDHQKIVQQLGETLEQQQSQKEQLEEHVHDLKKRLDQAEKAYYHGKTIDDLFREKDRLAVEEKQLQEDQEEINRQSELLQAANKAQELRPYEKQMDERKSEKNKLAQSLKENEEKLNEINENFKKIKEEYEKEKAKEPVRDELKDDVNKKREALHKLERLLSIQQWIRELTTKQTEWDKQLSHLSSLKKQLIEEKDQKSRLAAGEREVTSSLYEIKQKNERLKRSQATLLRLEKEWNKLENLRKRYRELQKEAARAKEESDHLKIRYEESVEKLKKHRAYHLALELPEGSPCPVCGSNEHPALAAKPQEVLSNAEMERLKKESDHKEKVFFNKHELMTTAEAEGRTHKQFVDSLHDEVRDITGDELTIEAVKNASAHIDKELQSNADSLSSKEKDLAAIHEAADRMIQIDQQVNEVTKDEQKVSEHLKKCSEEKIAYETEGNNLETNYKFVTFNLSDMKVHVKEAEQKLYETAKKWEEIQQQYSRKSEEFQQLKGKKTELERYLEQAEETFQAKEKVFNQTLDQLNFNSLLEYRQALLTEEQINKLTKRINDFTQHKDLVRNRLKELTNKLKEEQRPDLEILKQAFEEKKEAVQENQKQLHNCQLVYQQNQNALLTITSLIDEQKEFADRYYDLAEISNLARGDNSLKLSLERYVLASYLDEILIQANLRLDQMTDHRYQLLRSDALAKRGAQSGLELEVIDHHTGQKRSVRTLSGGEGFKASLSLALGMADVVQSHAGGVQLETLFIDEGFGTLDELSLEQAIGCLRTLQDGNRMLGIISHVAQLKEEIPAKLHIDTGPEGSTVRMAFQ